MRALLGLLVLVSLFAMAAAWQDRWTGGLKRSRDRDRRGDETLLSEVGEGWSRLIIGRPSGAEPLPYPERGWATDAVPAAAVQDAPLAPPAEDETSAAPDMVYRVRAGDILGRICHGHYGTSRPELVEALASYNQLATADDIREGQLLYLPAVDVLAPAE